MHIIQGKQIPADRAEEQLRSYCVYNGVKAGREVRAMPEQNRGPPYSRLTERRGGGPRIYRQETLNSAYYVRRAGLSLQSPSRHGSFLIL